VSTPDKSCTKRRREIAPFGWFWPERKCAAFSDVGLSIGPRGDVPLQTARVLLRHITCAAQFLTNHTAGVYRIAARKCVVKKGPGSEARTFWTWINN